MLPAASARRRKDIRENGYHIHFTISSAILQGAWGICFGANLGDLFQSKLGGFVSEQTWGICFGANLGDLFQSKPGRFGSEQIDGFAFLRKSRGACDSPPDCRQEPPFESTFTNSQTQKNAPSMRMSRLSGGGRWIRRQLSVAQIAYIVEMSPSFPEKAQDVVREIYIFYNVVFYNG